MPMSSVPTHCPVGRQRRSRPRRIHASHANAGIVSSACPHSSSLQAMLYMSIHAARVIHAPSVINTAAITK
jgi:hypothetical protein